LEYSKIEEREKASREKRGLLKCTTGKAIEPGNLKGIKAKLTVKSNENN